MYILHATCVIQKTSRVTDTWPYTWYSTNLQPLLGSRPLPWGSQMLMSLLESSRPDLQVTRWLDRAMLEGDMGNLPVDMGNLPFLFSFHTYVYAYIHIYVYIYIYLDQRVPNVCQRVSIQHPLGFIGTPLKVLVYAGQSWFHHWKFQDFRCSFSKVPFWEPAASANSLSLRGLMWICVPVWNREISKSYCNDL